MKVLLIEDEISLANSIVDYLQAEQILCEHAMNIRAAKELIAVSEFNVIVLDIMLPDGSGLDLLKWIKTNFPKNAVILVSAQNQLDVKLIGLNTGADDYITKPFAMAELVARLKVVNRRTATEKEQNIIVDNLEIDLDAFIAKVDNKELNLTKKEFNLLVYFFSNKNRVLSKQSIAYHLWGDYTDNLDNVDFVYQHVKNLRKKMLDAGALDYIKTVYGIGYKLEL